MIERERERERNIGSKGETINITVKEISKINV